MEKNLILEINRISELMGVQQILSEGPNPIANWIKSFFRIGAEQEERQVMVSALKNMERSTLAQTEKEALESTIQKLENPTLGKVTREELENLERIAGINLNWDQLAKDIVKLGKLPKTFTSAKDKLLQMVRSGQISKEEAKQALRDASNAIKGHPQELKTALGNEFEAELETVAASSDDLAMKKAAKDREAQKTAQEAEIARKEKAAAEQASQEMFVKAAKVREALSNLKTDIQRIPRGSKMEMLLGKYKTEIEKNIEALEKLNNENLEVFINDPALRTEYNRLLGIMKAQKPNEFTAVAKFMNEKGWRWGKWIGGITIAFSVLGYTVLNFMNKIQSPITVGKCIACAKKTPQERAQDPDCKNCPGLDIDNSGQQNNQQNNQQQNQQQNTQGKTIVGYDENGNPVYN